MNERIFWERVARGPKCWLWVGPLTSKGYGVMSIRREHRWTTIRAHRFAYELLVGPIPEGLLVHHECRNRACVNPTHLRPITNRENVLLGSAAGARSHCKRGHPLRRDSRGKGYCPICRRNYQRDWRARLTSVSAKPGREKVI